MRKSGTEMSASVDVEISRSVVPLGRVEAISPSMIESGTAMAAVTDANRTVLPIRSPMTSFRSAPLANEVPRSPRSKSPSQAR